MLGVAIAAVVVAVLILILSGGGSGGGRGQSRGGSASGIHKGSPTLVQAAASYLRLSPSEVRERLRAGQTLGQIAAGSKGASRTGLIDSLYAARAAAIKARKLPPGEERAELTLTRRELAEQVDRTRRRHSRQLRLASRYLGIGEAALVRRLGTGATLAQLAASLPGHTEAGLIDALLAPQRALLAHASSTHQISAAEERRTLARIERRARREVTRPGG